VGSVGTKYVLHIHPHKGTNHEGWWVKNYTRHGATATQVKPTLNHKGFFFKAKVIAVNQQ